MKILLCHNYYQQPGGEDQVFGDEVQLLESRGHEVIRFTLHNSAIDAMSGWEMSRKAIWNNDTHAALRRLIQQERPQIMHCANTFPLISPAAYYAAQREGVTVVQSLHNYRILCPNGQFLRDGLICEDCMGRVVAWPAVAHSCYRDSRSASAVVMTMLGFHGAKRTWTRAVDRYIALTDFAREKFVQGGLPEDRIAVKPNFVHPDPGPGPGHGGYAVFVGRLSQEKGIDTLLSAWTEMIDPIPLKIIGDGPLADRVRAAASRDRRIEWLNRRPLTDVLSIIGDAVCLVMPSIWYETFGRTTVEAFAKGTPAIASRLGAMVELVEDGRTGVHFTPGDARDLALKVQALWSSPSKLATMRKAARRVYVQRFTAEDNYHALVAIYEQAMQWRVRNAA